MVANMKRYIDIIDANRGTFACKLDDESITAVPAVVCAHPLTAFNDIIIGGNGSGKCHVWTPSINV